MSFDAASNRIERISRYAVWAGGASVLAIAAMVTVDVIVRKAFGVTLRDAPEISGYLFAVATALAYPYVLVRRANIRIDTLFVHLPRRSTAILDVIGLAVLLFVTAMLAYYAVGVFLESWSSNALSISSLRAPLWIPQLFWAGGIVLFLITNAFVLVYALVTLMRGRWDKVGLIAGIPSIDETIKEETHA